MKEIQKAYLTMAKKVLIYPEIEDVNQEDLVSSENMSAFILNMQSLGFVPSHKLLFTLGLLSQDNFTKQTRDIQDALIDLYGGRKNMNPMYKDFFDKNLNASDTTLALNAMMHYFTNGEWKPENNILSIEMPQQRKLDFKIIDLGSKNDLKQYIYSIANSKVSISQNQKDMLKLLLSYFNKSITYDDIVNNLNMSNKENMVYTLKLLYDMDLQDAFITTSFNHIKTSTDVLRLAMIFANGDYTLSNHFHNFKNIKRPIRRTILYLLDKVAKENKTALEDAAKYQKLWILIAEKLHPGDYALRYPNAMKFIDNVRNSKIRSWYSKIEKAYKEENIEEIISLLSKKPGEFARGLERLIRLAIKTNTNPLTVIESFQHVATNVASTLLLQLSAYFQDMYDKPYKDVRTFMPKGNLAKVTCIKETREPLSPGIVVLVCTVCNQALIKQFSQKGDLGKVFIQPSELEGYTVPLKTRTASKQLMTLPRGSKIKLKEDINFLRMFTYWKHSKTRIDIDLSAIALDEKFNQVGEIISYRNLREENLEIVHSGDFVSAKEGAAEYIDMNISKLKENKVKYVAMSVNSFSNVPYCNLEECFAGISVLSKENYNKNKQFRIKDCHSKITSERAFEPTNVAVRCDLSNDSIFSAVLVYDVENHEIIWLDASSNILLINGPYYDLSRNKTKFTECVQGFICASYPKFVDLINLHLIARNHELVDTPEEADLIISLDKGLTPYCAEEINSNWL